MKHSLLARLHSSSISYLISALLLLVGIPLYQIFILTPAGYSEVLSSGGPDLFGSYLTWISTHSIQFLIYRILLLLAFVLLLSLPFSLFRIIVAQELVAQMEDATRQEDMEEDKQRELPPYAWRGKGFAVLAAWTGLFGLLAYLLGTAASTLYLVMMSNRFTPNTAIPINYTTLSGLFSFITNSAGSGLIAISILFFGAIIARSGHNLWPGIWVAFGYVALAVATLFSGSAVGIAGAATTGQSLLTTPAMLLFALWVLWLGVMLIRLKPE
jgi:hypothetical protein